MNLFEDKLKNIRKDWGLLREYPDLPPGSEMPQGETPQGTATSVGEENPELGEEYNIPIRLGYGAYQIFQQYWMGQGDPLYALLSRRDDSVDIVTVEASEEEIDRLEQVAREIIEANEDPNHVRVAQGVLQDISALSTGEEDIHGPSDVANGTPPEEVPSPRFETKLREIQDGWGLNESSI